MICPLMTGYVYAGASNEDTGPHPVECFKDECGWWVEGKEKCSIGVIAEALDQLDEYDIEVWRFRVYTLLRQRLSPGHTLKTKSLNLPPGNPSPTFYAFDLVVNPSSQFFLL